MSASRPATSSRTSSRVSRVGRSSPRLGSPGSRRRSCSTTRGGSRTRQRGGGSRRATPCTTTSARSRLGHGVDFALDVVLDGEQRIVQAFSGELFAMHRAACEVSRQSAMRAVSAPFDVVVTSNAGFPLDQNLYQAVKGMSAAAQIVSDGGHDRLRRRVPRRVPRPRLLPRGADSGSRHPSAWPGRSRRARRRNVTSGRCRCRPTSSAAPASSCTRRSSRAARAPRGAPRQHRRRRGDRARDARGGRSRPRASASFPRDRLRSRTSPSEPSVYVKIYVPVVITRDEVNR